MARGNFGERLKRERELRDVSLKEITAATRIGPRFLDALENEEWDQLPGGVFNRGFVRAIAHFLGLNEENLLAEYDLARGDQNTPAPQPYENKIPRPPIWIPILALLGLLVVVAGLVAGSIYGWRRYAAHRAAKKSSSSTSIPVQTQMKSGALISALAATRVRVAGDDTALLEHRTPA
jgi:cytoskeletal protein RodZ